MEKARKKIGFEEVWASIHELSERQKETDRQIRDTSKQFKETDIYLKEKFSELREQVQETGKQIKETGKQQKETNKQLKETDKQLKETDKLQKETDRQLKETDRQLREKFSELKDYVGGIGRNNGDVAESYFYETILNTMKIGELDFEIIEKNVKRKNRRQNLEGEYDIILTNSESIAIIEVKYKLHPDDIDKIVNKKIPVFKKLFPEKKDYKLYIVVAGLSIPDDSKKLAFKHGFFVLTQGGGKLNLEHDDIKTY